MDEGAVQNSGECVHRLHKKANSHTGENRQGVEEYARAGEGKTMARRYNTQTEKIEMHGKTPSHGQKKEVVANLQKLKRGS